MVSGIPQRGSSIRIDGQLPLGGPYEEEGQNQLRWAYAALFHAALYCAALSDAALYCAALYCAALSDAALSDAQIAQHAAALQLDDD